MDNLYAKLTRFGFWRQNQYEIIYIWYQDQNMRTAAYYKTALNIYTITNINTLFREKQIQLLLKLKTLVLL